MTMMAEKICCLWRRKLSLKCLKQPCLELSLILYHHRHRLKSKSNTIILSQSKATLFFWCYQFFVWLQIYLKSLDSQNCWLAIDLSNKPKQFHFYKIFQIQGILYKLRFQKQNFNFSIMCSILCLPDYLILANYHKK